MDIKWQFVTLAIILIVSSVSAKGKCIDCSSSTDEKCQSEPSTIQKTCDADKCFTLIENNGKITRGCVTETPKCDGGNCKACDAVDTAPCNIQTDLFWCKSCSSSSVADCAYWQNEDSITHEFCASGVTKCVMEIKDDKHISRHCASKNDEVCETGKKCEICGEKACNKGVFPSNRRKCYQCNSDADSKCATPTKYNTEIKSFPCLFYDESEKCFEHGSSDTNMIRGCASDTTAYGKCTGESPKDKCKECTTDGCNVDEYKIEATAKCIQCKTDSESKCVGAHSAEDAKNCETKIEYWKPQGCYTNKVNGKVDRGCIQDFECDAASTCTSCINSTAACNIADQTAVSCYKCRSDINPKCSLPLQDGSFKSEPCGNQTNVASGEQCYIEKYDDIIIRSCLSDTDAKTRKNCIDTNYKYCTSCKGDNCNEGAAPNSAHSIALTSALFALTLFVLKFF